MTKADLMEEVARVVELTRRDAEDVLEVILGSMAAAVRNGDKVEIRRFGSLRTRQRRGRVSRNPKSGQPVEVPPKRVAFFKPAKALLEIINRQPPPNL